MVHLKAIEPKKIVESKWPRIYYNIWCNGFRPETVPVPGYLPASCANFSELKI